MGSFSFITGDTHESVINHKVKKVYLIHPEDRSKNVVEGEYGGFGDFGCVDIFEWIVDINNIDISKMKISKRNLGLALYGGGVYRDTFNGKMYSFHYPEIDEKVSKFSSFQERMDEYCGLTPNKLKDYGIWEKVDIAKLIGLDNVLMPRISYSKNAKYEDLDDTSDCPNQGFSNRKYEYEKSEKRWKKHNISIIRDDDGYIHGVVSSEIGIGDNSSAISFLIDGRDIRIECCSQAWIESNEVKREVEYSGALTPSLVEKFIFCEEM